MAPLAVATDVDPSQGSINMDSRGMAIARPAGTSRSSGEGPRIVWQCDVMRDVPAPRDGSPGCVRADYCPPISARIEGWHRRLAPRGLDGARGWLDIGDGTIYSGMLGQLKRSNGRSMAAGARYAAFSDAGREDAGS